MCYLTSGLHYLLHIQSVTCSCLSTDTSISDYTMTAFFHILFQFICHLIIKTTSVVLLFTAVHNLVISNPFQNLLQ